MSDSAERFIVFATPRSGSNWLCTLLDSHPQILCHHELYNPEGIHLAWSQRDSLDFGSMREREIAPLKLLERAWSITRGHALVGFKMNLGQCPAVRDNVLADPSVRKLLISRRNRVRAYISETIAQLSGRWESYPDSPVANNVGPVRVEVSELKAHAARNHAYCEELRRRLAQDRQAFFEIDYEDIGVVAVQRRLLTFLGVDPDCSLSGRTQRMNPEPLPALIANYSELTTALAGTEFATDLPPEHESA